MKRFLILLIVCLLTTPIIAKPVKGLNWGKKIPSTQFLAKDSKVSFITCSNSITGPFRNPDTVYVDEVFYIRMDVTPLGSLNAEFWADVNNNGLIDNFDFTLGMDTYIDNDTSDTKRADLDPTPGIILTPVDPEMAPSMTVILKATEGLTSATGVLVLINHPQSYSLSGNIYSKTGGAVPGAMVFAMKDSLHFAIDLADDNGGYSLPVDTGLYMIQIQDMQGQYSSFDTTLNIFGNMTKYFYLDPLSSYIRGFVKDELDNPLANIGVYIESQNGNDIRTDINGEYKMMVSPGKGRIGLSSETLLPYYLSPYGHDYEIAENDSIVDNSVSNFTCYTANSTITGTVTMGADKAAIQPIPIDGSSNEIQSWTETLTNLSGQFSLPVHSSITLQPKYYVSVNTNHWQYPVPAGMYPDTSYWNLDPGAVANFNLLLADTSAVDPFNGDYIPPSQMWDIYQYNHGYTGVECVGDRLKVQCTNWGSESGVGVVTRNPFQLNNREYRIYIDHAELGSNNSIYVVLSGRRIYWNHPNNENNTLMLSFSKQSVGGGWRLQQNYDWGIVDLWQSPETTGRHILFQFNNDASILTLKIDGIVKYEGPWAQHFSIAYVHLLEFNSYPNSSTPVYFDEFFVGAVGSTGVREIGGELPQDFKLEQNYPNPFNPATTINFQLPISSTVSIKVYNVLGQEVADLLNSEMNAGKYEIAFDASKLPSGIYYYRLNALDSKTGQLLMNSSKKAILLK